MIEILRVHRIRSQLKYNHWEIIPIGKKHFGILGASGQVYEGTLNGWTGLFEEFGAGCPDDECRGGAERHVSGGEKEQAPGLFTIIRKWYETHPSRVVGAVEVVRRNPEEGGFAKGGEEVILVTIPGRLQQRRQRRRRCRRRCNLRQSAVAVASRVVSTWHVLVCEDGATLEDTVVSQSEGVWSRRNREARRRSQTTEPRIRRHWSSVAACNARSVLHPVLRPLFRSGAALLLERPLLSCRCEFSELTHLFSFLSQRPNLNLSSFTYVNSIYTHPKIDFSPVRETHKPI